MGGVETRLGGVHTRTPLVGKEWRSVKCSSPEAGAQRKVPGFQFALVAKRSFQPVPGKKTPNLLLPPPPVPLYFLLLFTRLAFFIRHQSVSLFLTHDLLFFFEE